MTSSFFVYVHYLFSNRVVLLQSFHSTSQCVACPQILEHGRRCRETFSKELRVAIDGLRPLSSFVVGSSDKLLGLMPSVSDLFTADPHLQLAEIYSKAAAIGATVRPIV